MTIEKSPAPFAIHTAASTGSHGARSKAAAGDAAADGTGAGFMAILGALDDASADSPVPDAGNADALSADVSSAATTGAPVPPPFDASVMLQQNPQIAAAQSAALAATVPDPVVLAQALVGAALLQSPPAAPSALVPLTQSLSTVAAPLVPAGPPTVSKLGNAEGQPPTAQVATSPALSTPGTDAMDTADSVAQGMQHAFARAKAGQGTVPTLADTGATTKGSAAVADDRAESNKFLATMEQARTVATPRALEPVLAPLVITQDKQEKSRNERSSGRVKDADPTYSAPNVGASAADASLSGAAAPAMAPDMQVAEQVSYWVSHNVQNAELSLDGLGQSPVQVSISLQGNEAQISFRTDEAAARDVLQNAAAHLTDMLQREGLVLTGVSVGHSGSGNADGSDRRARPNVRQTQVAPLQAASLDNGPRLRTAAVGAAGRSVDLFV